MSRLTPYLVPVAFLALLVLAGCKLVKNEPEGAADGNAAAGAQQPSKFEVMAEEMWQAKVLPYLEEEATELSLLKAAIAQDAATAGDSYGYRAGGEGTPWSFATRFSGQVVDAKTDTRAATARVDIDGDGTADATLQLGPVIRGTALRDVLPFISFSDVSDQIEFANLSRALNAKAYDEVLAGFPREGLAGKQVTVLGAFTLRNAAGEILVTPVALSEGPTP